MLLSKEDFVWINGLFLVARRTTLVFSRSASKTCLDGNERVECDDGYKAEDPGFCKTRKGLSSMYATKEERGLQNTVRARQETAHKRFKQFESLSGIVCYDLSKHSDFVYAVATISQIAFEMGHPLFQIEKNIPSKTHAEIVQQMDM